MNYTYIKYTTLQVIKECNIHTFPIDCLDIFHHYNIKLYKYSELDNMLKQYCLSYSDDAYHYKDKVFYNDLKPKIRIRFTLMHELGHIILNHGENHTPKMEQEANYFASNILAPRMALHYARCKNYKHVNEIFNLSYSAADFAFNDYQQWLRVNHFKMDYCDKEMYSHFYDPNYDGFVYNKSECNLCGKDIYNTTLQACPACQDKLSYIEYIKNHGTDASFLGAEHYWLYGNMY